MRIVLLALFSLLSTSLFATTYTFTGNGNWNDASKWDGSRRGSLGTNDTVIITGTCTFDIDWDRNNGFIWIKPGGTLTLKSETYDPSSNMFESYGPMRTEGTLHIMVAIGIYASFEIKGAITNYAGFLSTEPFVIEAGATFHNKSTVVPAIADITIHTGGIFKNEAKTSGNFSFKGSGTFSNSSTLAPGNSPGTVTVAGDYVATSTAIHNFEVGGTSAGAYDKLLVGGTGTLDGTLNVTLINGFVPSTTHEIPIITGTISGTFATANIPSSYALIYRSNEVVLQKFVVLPVNFTAVEAKKENGAVKLLWKVESEQNLVRYEVEKSNTGSGFRKVGTVSSSSQRQYSFTDADSEGKSYYRIKSIDMDGKTGYSAIVSVRDEETRNALKAAITAGGNTLKITHRGANIGGAITIYAADGRLVKLVMVARDTIETTVDLSGIKAGTYIVHYNDERLKVVKQ